MAFNAQKTGWSIENYLDELAEYNDDSYRQFYYATYSNDYHTDPDSRT